MMIPQDVQSYLNAREWMFWHWGVPVSLVYLAIFGFMRWLEYKEDCSVNDDEGETFKNAGKTLGL